MFNGRETAVREGDGAVHESAQAGMVVLWFALALTVLLGCCGFAIDIGRWYFEAQHLQKAADAAALAGVVHLPADPSTAKTKAYAVTTQNGYASGVDPTVLVQPCPGGQPGCPANRTPAGSTQFQVTVSHTVSNFFAQILGVATTTIRKSAIAEYEEPVAMGSPANIFGNEPVGPGDIAWTNSAFTPALWGNIMGPQTNKGSGDAIQGLICDAGTGAGQNCASSTNSDYTEAGYIYKITVDPAQHLGGTLHIEVFDPAAIHVGDHCDSNGLGDSSHTAPSTNAESSTNPYSPTAAESAIRYAWGDTTNGQTGKFCTGDNNGQDQPNAPTTTMVVRNYTNPGGTVEQNPALTETNCSGVQYQGYGSGGGHNLKNALQFGNAGYVDSVAKVFRQWVSVCEFVPATYNSGTYLLQIRTNIALGVTTGEMQGVAPASNLVVGTGLHGGGSNRFSLRAAWFDGLGKTAHKAPSNNDVSIAGVRNMGLYANATAGDPSTPNFYMARVLPPASPGASVVLQVNLWDIGDCFGCGAGGVNLSFSLPNLTGSPAVLDCTVYSHMGSGNQVVDLKHQCSFPTIGNGLSGPYGGQSDYLVIQINISGYTCDPTNRLDCWVRMGYAPTGAGQLNDTTTWSAALLGDPVRLVQ